MRLLPPALLIVVGVAQMVLTGAVHLTPWKGGGFGMFSTLDHAPFRGVDIVVEGPDRSETIEIPQSLEVIAARAVNCPSDWLLRRFAADVVARERRHDRPVSRVRLTVWGTQYDRVTLAATERTIRSFLYEPPP